MPYIRPQRTFKNMLRTFLMAWAMLTCLVMGHAQDKPAYQLFDKAGQPVTYAQMLDTLLQAQVIFFGELHNNPIAHWLQLELSHDLHDAVGARLRLGAEMFEADNQLLLDEYLQGYISENNFEEEARLWKNYGTDYKPLVQMALRDSLAFIATNVPRRYANLVFRQGLEGLDSLSSEARSYLAPLPIEFDPELPGYRSMVEMMGGHGGDASLNLPMAQAIKDATMAHFIGRHARPEGIFLHFNGAYHSDNYEGILWYLQRYRPELGLATISTLELEDIGSLPEENWGKADFIIAIPATMTKTY